MLAFMCMRRHTDKRQPSMHLSSQQSHGNTREGGKMCYLVFQCIYLWEGCFMQFWFFLLWVDVLLIAHGYILDYLHFTGLYSRREEG